MIIKNKARNFSRLGRFTQNPPLLAVFLCFGATTTAGVATAVARRMVDRKQSPAFPKQTTIGTRFVRSGGKMMPARAAVYGI
ncbi:hypothetical protein [Accumulibacter sp.]|uniref:hypothetical protein n=1 Tax=Accumulibacter sp. TaxID=2053492 RepID=UPI001D8A193B|nr:hypothetical protein [Accumulibacter sp.]MCB1933095.1 hypothetical protein [Accumulibacter sp.]MCP5227913.1 hypothetical protein [Accumulibacter sp.]